MRNADYSMVRNCSLVVIAMCFWLLAGDALAAETSGDWRPTYDLVLRYVNFLILVFLLLKYARKPLVDFFKGKSEDVKKEIQQIEEAKQEAEEQVKALQLVREQSREQFEKLKERIIAQGQAKQEQMIEDAKREGRLLVESARQKIAHRVTMAHHNLRAEMVDMAMDMALERLPEKITDQDNQRFLDRYLESTRTILTTI